MSKQNNKNEIERLLSGGNIDRATFLKAMSAAGLITMLPKGELLAYSSNVKAKIAIVGGGAAGLSVAARLMSALSNADITIIDPEDVQYYQPGFTMIGGGIYTPDEVHIPQSDAIPSGVKWEKDAVVTIDPDNNKIQTKGGKTIDYDFLVVATGTQMNFEQIEGITRSELGAGNAHSIYDFNGSQRAWKAIDEFTNKGGKEVYVNTYTKHKCGGAPKKILLLTEHILAERNQLEIA